MNVGKTLFTQIMEFISWTSFSRIVQRYGGDSGVRRLTCAEQFRAMAFAQCLTALFAVWITHQGTENSGIAGRSQRGVFAIIAYLMFYHREHHLFPRVPVHKLPKLAARLDAQVPGYASSRQPVLPWFDPIKP